MTVLYHLKKLKHPVIQNRWRKNKILNLQDDITPFNNNINFRYTRLFSTGEDVLHIELKFGYTEGVRKQLYTIIIFRDRVSIDFYWYTNNDFGQEIKLDMIPFDELESILFQQSLLESTGMIGTQEIAVIEELRDLYFK